MLNHKLSEMYRKEKKEHPWLSEGQIERLVRDHIRSHKKGKY